ncbi:MAG: MarR family transcriptional regulator [Erysipelotrichaceae bacterium]|nr:MarR family transcriptional regulator [Erysipelotrichaceae bacterium]
MSSKYDCLKIENQLCFPLYVASKEVVRRYQPYLKHFDLTYTQYIAMMVIWEKEVLSVKELCEALYLDSGTVSPLIRKLRDKGYISMRHSKEDERVQLVSLTEKGEELQEKLKQIPSQIGSCVKLSEEDAGKLYTILYQLIGGLKQHE